ncbi:hypothetical protein LINPERHAP1_LOCUS35173 [Linum perenne]
MSFRGSYLGRPQWSSPPHCQRCCHFWRHQRYNRSVRFHPIGFHFAPCVLQPDFQALQEEPRFLAQLRHHSCIRGGRGYRRHRQIDWA